MNSKLQENFIPRDLTETQLSEEVEWLEENSHRPAFDRYGGLKVVEG